MDEMNLYTLKKKPFFLISELSAYDLLQVKELCISFSGSSRYPKLEKTAEAAFKELCSCLKFLFAPVLRCITDKSFSCGRFPHNESIVYKWFDHPRSGETRNEVKAINVEKEVGTPWNGNNLFNTVKLNELELLDDDTFEIFFHGTSHIYAEHIIDGIDLKNGGEGMDFSSGDGFYVSKDLSLGREYAARRFGENNSAVLVFKVRKVELRGDNNNNGLDLKDIDRKKKEWQALVRNFLSSKPSKRFLKTVKEYDFIEGPMVAKGKKDFVNYPTPKNDSYQLCVRTDSCASLFDRSLCAVVYFAL